MPRRIVILKKKLCEGQMDSAQHNKRIPFSGTGKFRKNPKSMGDDRRQPFFPKRIQPSVIINQLNFFLLFLSSPTNNDPLISNIKIG